MRRDPSAALLAALSAAFLAASAGLVPAAAAGAACPDRVEGFRRLKTAEAEIAYSWQPAELKVGQFFVAEVVACETPGREPVDGIALDATMPAHGHGMNYRPRAERVGTGHYRFTGLMLHMPGTWQVTFDLIQGDRRTRLTRDVNLK